MLIESDEQEMASGVDASLRHLAQKVGDKPYYLSQTQYFTEHFSGLVVLGMLEHIFQSKEHAVASLTNKKNITLCKFI